MLKQCRFHTSTNNYHTISPKIIPVLNFLSEIMVGCPGPVREF